MNSGPLIFKIGKFLNIFKGGVNKMHCKKAEYIKSKWKLDGIWIRVNMMFLQWIISGPMSISVDFQVELSSQAPTCILDELALCLRVRNRSLQFKDRYHKRASGKKLKSFHNYVLCSIHLRSHNHSFSLNRLKISLLRALGLWGLIKLLKKEARIWPRYNIHISHEHPWRAASLPGNVSHMILRVQRCLIYPVRNNIFNDQRNKLVRLSTRKVIIWREVKGCWLWSRIICKGGWWWWRSKTVNWHSQVNWNSLIKQSATFTHISDE